MNLAPFGLALVLASMVLGTLLSKGAMVVAPWFGLVDKPGGRKAHKAPTPMGGGVAIWLTVVLMLGLGAVVLWFGPLPESLARHANGGRARLGQLGLIMGLATAIMAMGLGG